MVAISLSGSGEGLGRAIARGYSTAFTKPPTAALETRLIVIEARAAAAAALASA